VATKTTTKIRMTNPRSPYDTNDSFSEAIRLDEPSNSEGSMLFLVRDIDLKLPQGAKRAKGNSGSIIEWHEKGDYCRPITVLESSPYILLIS
jgi:hypothetical protein